MSGYDPFGELFPGEPILDGVTTEGIFPLEAAADVTVELVGAVEAAVEVVGTPLQVHTLNAPVGVVAAVVGGFLIATEIVGSVEAAVQVAGAAVQTHTLNGTVDTVAVVVGGFIIAAGLVGVVEAAVEVDGSTLTVTADVFVGWGIPVGVA